MKKNKPDIRFVGFANAWELRKLGEVGQMYQPQTVTGSDLIESGIPVFGANGYIGFYTDYNHKEDQVTISARGEGTGTPSYVKGPVWITGNSMVVNVDESGVDKHYLYANLSSRSIKKFVTGGAQPQLTRDVLVKVPISIPRHDEQKQIGTFFMSLDNLITLHQRELDLLKLQKKAFLQKMFPQEGKTAPEIRFEGFTDAWELRKLEEIVDVFDGTHQTPQYTESGVKFVSVENIANLETKKFISEEAYDKEYSKKQAEKGDILMTRIGDIGTAKVVETTEPLAYYVTLALLKPKGIDSDFLAWLIASPEVQIDIWKRTLHIAFPKKINLGEINQVDLKLTALDEQIKIGLFFKSLDNLIALHQRELDNYKELKKGFLQKMFV